jgi:hypothetical protein
MIYWEEYINPVKSFSSRVDIRICQNAPTPLNLPYYCEMVKLHYNALTVFEKEPFVKRRCQACFTGMCFSTKIISDETPQILGGMVF